MSQFSGTFIPHLTAANPAPVSLGLCLSPHPDHKGWLALALGYWRLFFTGVVSYIIANSNPWSLQTRHLPQHRRLS